jgi:hypothetical protein
MTVSTVLSPTALATAERSDRVTLWQRLYAALELAGRRRAARQLVLLDDATLLKVGLSRAELEETLR